MGKTTLIIAILCCIATAVYGQGLRLTGVSAIAGRTKFGFAALENRTGIDRVVFTSQNTAFQWNFDTNAVVGVTNTYPVTSDAVGMSIDDKGIWDTNARRLVFCLTNKVIYSVNLDVAGAASAVFTFTSGAANTATTCIVDFTNNYAYIAADRYLARVPLSAPGAAWSGTPTIATRRSFDMRSSAIDEKNNFVYFGSAGGEIIQVSRTEPQGFNTNPFRVFTNGGGDLISIGVDTTNNYIFFGTSFGLGLR